MRTFELHRDVDHSGLSGTGIVAEGVEFSDGTAVVRWREVEGEHYDRGVRATTVMFPSVEAVEALHGHGGATRLVWVEAEPPPGSSGRGPVANDPRGRLLADSLGPCSAPRFYVADRRGVALCASARHLFRTDTRLGRAAFTAAFSTGALVLHQHVLK